MATSTTLRLASVARAVVSRAFASTHARIASYNVLSDELCDPKFFNQCAAEHCAPNFRLQRVKKKLSKEIEQGAIICLQEVSRRWGAQFNTFFEQHGYAHVACLSGSKKNGYMGQTLAWRRDLYELIDNETVRLADTVPATTDTIESAADDAKTKFQSLIKKIFGIKETPTATSPFIRALSRHNSVVVSRLKDRQSGLQFCVANYHMPCLFGSEAKLQVMTIHVALLMQVACLSEWNCDRQFA